MKLKSILLAIIATVLLSGCETYKKQAWTPDSLNYTYARDRKTGDECDYFGVGWSLK